MSAVQGAIIEVLYRSVLLYHVSRKRGRERSHRNILMAHVTKREAA